MTLIINNLPGNQAPSCSSAKKSRATRRFTAKGIFGLLPDWKIDTQKLKDELRG